MSQNEHLDAYLCTSSSEEDDLPVRERRVGWSPEADEKRPGLKRDRGELLGTGPPYGPTSDPE
jgi:hypothetical protein